MKLSHPAGTDREHSGVRRTHPEPSAPASAPSRAEGRRRARKLLVPRLAVTETPPGEPLALCDQRGGDPVTGRLQGRNFRDLRFASLEEPQEDTEGQQGKVHANAALCSEVPKVGVCQSVRFFILKSRNPLGSERRPPLSCDWWTSSTKTTPRGYLVAWWS